MNLPAAEFLANNANVETLAVGVDLGIEFAGPLAEIVDPFRKPGVLEIDHGNDDGAGLVGGVGMLAVAATALAGFQVIACTRKNTLSDTLLSLGASAVQSPEEALPSDKKPLSSARYLGAIDTVGGELLANILRVVAAGGAVASIGNAGGVALSTTVYPFILRGITLAGIDAAGLPSREKRQELWAKLGVLWPLMNSGFPVRHIGLQEIGDWAAEMRSGCIKGRAVVIPQKEARGDYAHD